MSNHENTAAEVKQALEDALRRGLAEAEEGYLEDLGSFDQFLDEDD